MTVFEELKRRGLIAQMTNEERIEQELNKGGVSFYIGFDATADSLHVGHFLQLMVMGHLQRAGHRPIALLGTGTTMVGDPSGKSDMRKMLTTEQIDYNAECFRRQMSRFLDFSDGKALIVRNGDWLRNINYIDFLREIGVHFSVNKMLSAECYKSRLETGLTFLELNYMIMQSYDFLALYRKHNCTMQLGGDDQWSNIIGGVNLIRKVDRGEACGMTFTLLTTKEGKKMGKTESGAVWLDAEKTSPYEFYQYWRNVADEDVIRVMKLLTYIPIEEIEAMESWEGSELNKAKELLAHELTKTVHGVEDADKAANAAKALFGAGESDENMPTTSLTADSFTDGTISLVDLLVICGLAPSKREARQLITQGSVTIDDVKQTDIALTIATDGFTDGQIIIKKGKKTFHKVTL
ncbi:MAG TPA: tyrosine--tRNA ligase [Oscillospiraceae bacterium]|nr:tyrosine--tRNA ligase [Oscillospiraceae bacterium]